MQVQAQYKKDNWVEKKIKNEVDSSKILPLDPNTPDPFLAGCKCHPPSGKYIGKKQCNIFECLEPFQNSWICYIQENRWKTEQNNRIGAHKRKAHLLHQHIAI